MNETWIAVVTDSYGYVLTDEDVRGWAAAIDAGKSGWGVPCEPPTSVEVVTGSATPKPQSDHPDDQKILRMPGSWRTLDKLIEIDVEDHEPADVLLIWERAQACADGLNAPGVIPRLQALAAELDGEKDDYGYQVRNGLKPGPGDRIRAAIAGAP